MGRACPVSDRLFQPFFLLWKPLPHTLVWPHVSAPAPQAGWGVAAFTVVYFFCPKSKGTGRGSFPAPPHWPLSHHRLFLSAPSSQARMNFWEGGIQVLWTDLTLKTQEPQNSEGVK